MNELISSYLDFMSKNRVLDIISSIPYNLITKNNLVNENEDREIGEHPERSGDIGSNVGNGGHPDDGGGRDAANNGSDRISVGIGGIERAPEDAGSDAGDDALNISSSMLSPLPDEVIIDIDDDDNTVTKEGTSALVDSVNDLPDFILTDEILSEFRSPRKKAEDNILAIKLLMDINQSNRSPSESERTALARYVGWGGIPQAFRSIDGQASSGWDDIVKGLEGILSEKELNSARMSTLDAHYTSSDVIQAIYEGVKASGIQPRKILESSCGVGNFIGLSPFPQEDFEATEIDPVTAGIAKILYPKANILATGFNQALHLMKPTYDLVVGNPPFGKARIFDSVNSYLTDTSPNTHTYFFNKALEKTVGGGLVAMVVSRYMMDSKLGRNFRLDMARRSNLVAAFRLPDTAFKENAGTEVVTDIIFLQKRHVLIQDDDEYFYENPPSWVDTSITYIQNNETGNTEPCEINNYFIDFPDNVMGVHCLDRGMYSNNEYCVQPISDWQNKLTEKTSKIVWEYALPDRSVPLYSDFSSEGSELYKDYPVFSGSAKHGEFILVSDDSGGKTFLGVYQDNGSVAQKTIGYTPVVIEQGRANDDEDQDEESDRDNLLEFEVSKASFERLVAYIPLRDSLKRLVQMQVTEKNDDSLEMRVERGNLKQHYDAFVEKFGMLNRPYNIRAIMNDVYGARVSALESDYKKAITPAISKRTGESVRKESCGFSPIFSTRTQFPALEKPRQASTVDEAIAYSLNFMGGVKVDYMVSMLERPWSDIRDELGDRIIFTENGWKESSGYIFGDVVEKIDNLRAWAETSTEDQSDEVIRSIRMLEASLPEAKKIESITPLQGAHWIPLEITRAFIDECFGRGVVIAEKISSLGSWAVRASGVGGSSMEFATARMPPAKMAAHFLLSKVPVIMDTIKHSDGTTTSVLNAPETELARSKMDALVEKWSSWIVSPERSEELEIAYDKIFNRFAVYRPILVGHLTFPGTSNAVVTPRPTQKMGAMAIINNKSTLLDHAVGAGKTITAVLAIMEARRLGLSRKPMITCPNGLEMQYIKAFADLYPSSSVLVASKSDMAKKNRQRFLSRVAMDDSLDCVIIPHSTYSLIARDPEFDIQFIQSEIERYRDALRSTQIAEGGNTKKSSSVKKVEAKIKKLEFKINQKIASLSGDKNLGIHFGNIGFDFVVTDESQMFKNIPFLTGMRNVRGLGNPEGSSKALDSLLKARFIIESGGRYVDMSGTPESNTLAEVYLSQTKHIPDTLARMGISQFDQWMATFVLKTSEFQYLLTGAYKEEIYPNKIANLSSLRAMSSYRHIITIEDVKRMALESGMPEIKLPNLKGGKANVITVEKTKLQNEIIGYQIDINENGDPIYNEDSIMHVLASLNRKSPKKGESNVLSCISELRKAGLSSKAYNGALDDKSPKLESAAREILSLYNEYQDDLGTQIVFLDMSTPKKKGRPSKEMLQVRKWVSDIERGEAEGATDDDIEARSIAEEALSEYSSTEIDDLLSDESSWSAYVELRDIAAELGIPKEQFAFVHEYDTLDKREELFGKVRSGQIRVVMGSTSLMGAGVNIQDRIVGMHMLDAPWRPDQMLQRIGRMIRQGNILLEKYGDAFEVALNYYVTEGSVDAAMYQINANKLVFINAIRARDGSETASDVSFDPVAISAAASGNLVLQFNEVVKKAFKKLQNLQYANQGEASARQRMRDNAQKSVDYVKNTLDSLKMVMNDLDKLHEHRSQRKTENENIKAEIDARKTQLKDIAHQERESVKSVLSKNEGWDKLSGKDKEDAVREAKRAIALKLEKDIDELGHAPVGWIDVEKNGSITKNMTMTYLAENIILKAKNLVDKRVKMDVPLFEMGDFEYTLEVNQGFGFSKYLATVVCSHKKFGDIEDRYELPGTLTAMSPNQITSAGLSIMGMPRRIAQSCSDAIIRGENARKTLNSLSSEKTNKDSHSTVMAQLDFLRESQNVLKGMLRCGLSRTADAVDMIRHISHETIDEVGDDSRIYKIIHNKAFRELAAELLVPLESFVKYWDKHGEIVIEDINAGKIPKIDDILIEGALTEEPCMV